MFGSAFTSFPGATADLYAGPTCYGAFVGGYAFASGGASSALIRGYASGSFIWVYAAPTGGATHLATSVAGANGAFVQGRTTGTGSHILRAAAAGSFVQGLVTGGAASIIESLAAGTGSFAQGVADAGGIIRTSGAGALAQGEANGAGSNLIASAAGSLACGTASAGNAITASGIGSLAMGSSAAGAIGASATNAFQFGVGTNSQASSLSVGTGPRFKGTVGAPTTPRNGDYYVDGSGFVVIRSGAVNIVLDQSPAYTPTNVVTDRSYNANSTTIDELADVLGTLIADLQATGILA